LFQVDNYLPSISSAIGGYTPQRYVWRVCIALHCSPRFIAVIGYYNLFHQRQVPTCQWLYHAVINLNTVLNVVENFCLLLLTCISSTEDYSELLSRFCGYENSLSGLDMYSGSV